jgi:ADP-heptose:LPS heptosyltransferase
MPLIPWLAKIKERIGFTYKVSILSFLLTKKTPSKIVFDGYFERHIIESFLDLLRVKGLAFTDKDTICKSYISQNEIDFMKKKLNLYGGKIVTVHTMSKSDLKNWPQDRFIQFLPALASKHNLLIYLIGSKKEWEYNEKIRKADEKHIFNICGDFKIREYGALLKQSNLFIGNDSGFAHYSSSLGTKSLVLFGLSDPQQCEPKGYGKTVTIFNNDPKNTVNFLRNGNVEADLNSMKLISVEEVLVAAENLLKSKK